MIWDQESLFRSLIQKAAKQSKEPHAWKDHNFALCPPDFTHFQHKMITAEDTYSRSILGFCEVFMLLTPTGDCCDINPTVANLVISPHYRRRGIGSNLLESAKRYVNQNWRTQKVALYVKRWNVQAI